MIASYVLLQDKASPRPLALIGVNSSKKWEMCEHTSQAGEKR
jgi:hypothetical protein